MDLESDGIPFSKELFLSQPDAARQFLIIFTEKSYGILPDWSQWTEDEITAEAISRLEEVEAELQAVDWLKRFGTLH